jgi:hypothetical protein
MEITLYDETSINGLPPNTASIFAFIVGALAGLKMKVLTPAFFAAMTFSTRVDPVIMIRGIWPRYGSLCIRLNRW